MYYSSSFLYDLCWRVRGGDGLWRGTSCGYITHAADNGVCAISGYMVRYVRGMGRLSEMRPDGIARSKVSYLFGWNMYCLPLAPLYDKHFITAAEVRTIQRWLISVSFREWLPISSGIGHLISLWRVGASQVRGMVTSGMISRGREGGCSRRIHHHSWRISGEVANYALYSGRRDCGIGQFTKVIFSDY